MISRLSARSAGQPYVLVYVFASSYPDSHEPEGVILDSAGNLYGVARYGGAHSSGTVFELAPSPEGGWAETVLYNFTGKDDGGNPNPGLIWDASGNLYGSTSAAGANGSGVVFELSPTGNDGWTFQVLYAFSGAGDGCSPFSLLLDSSGDIYGTAGCGGVGYQGMIFKLTQSGGTWARQTIHRFSMSNSDGYDVQGVAMNSVGQLYGTTYSGGRYSYGSAFEFKPNNDGTWTEVDLHSFTGGVDGANPDAGLIIGIDGNFYGTTLFGGSGVGQNGYGVAYSLVP